MNLRTRFWGSLPFAAMAPLGLIFETDGLTEPLAILISIATLGVYMAIAIREARRRNATRWFWSQSIAGKSRSVQIAAILLETVGAVLVSLWWGLGAVLIPLFEGLLRGIWGEHGITPARHLFRDSKVP